MGFCLGYIQDNTTNVRLECDQPMDVVLSNRFVSAEFLPLQLVWSGQGIQENSSTTVPQDKDENSNRRQTLRQAKQTLQRVFQA